MSSKDNPVNSISKLDVFGYPVHNLFNFNAQYTTHKTLAGGLTTIVVYTLMLIFVITKLTLLWGSDRDFVRLDRIQTDFDNLGKVLLDGNTSVFL